VPALDLTDDELAAVIAALKEKLDRDHYPRAPRLEPFRTALAKLDPKSTPRPVAPRPLLPQAMRTRGTRRQRVAGGVITLAEMRAKGMTMLKVPCHRCDRRGRLRIERLIAGHGTGVLDLRAIIAADRHGCGIDLRTLRRAVPRAATLALDARSG